MPAPKKGKRFGKSASHQRLMLANLAAHLIEAEAITTTETKAKPGEEISELKSEIEQMRRQLAELSQRK